MPQNRLAETTSPYLRQHADNPVDWYPWGPEALARAQAEDKPILLSVGYSACHWCHVMAHESFESPAIAALMNAHYVNIKVDREERPDIDAIYQKVVALMGEGGGWPLTVFLTPDQRPFYGGTYFPPEDRYGRPGFPRLLQALAELWAQRREDALRQAEVFMNGFAEIARSVDEDAAMGSDLALATPEALREAGARLLQLVDPRWGGLGKAPKFPNVPSLRLLLRLARAEAGSELVAAASVGHDAGAALRLTLEQMWRGGIYDHLRGGFARYSTDQEWLIPHFEKMLYDNGLLLELYAEASAVFGHGGEHAHLRRVVEETADYLVADMRCEAGPGAGTFFSATDADSEGVEGKYFSWTPAQLEELLDPATAKTFARAYGVSEAGNFEDGMSVLHLPEPLPPALERELAPARAKLLEHRYTRVPPLRDEKVLAGWNALVISGLCKAADAAQGWGPGGEPARVEAWTAHAREACAALLAVHRDGEGRLLRVSWAGEAHTRAMLEDLALLARACLDLHELTLEPRWHDEAEALAAQILAHHRREGGGLYMSAADAEALVERTESQHDSPLPSGLAAAVEVLARLELGGPARAAGQAGFDARAFLDQTLARFARAHARPTAFAGLIDAAQWLGPAAVHVTIRAASPAVAQELAGPLRRARARLDHGVALAFSPAPELAAPEAIVCRAQTCSLPTRDLDALLDGL